MDIDDKSRSADSSVKLKMEMGAQPASCSICGGATRRLFQVVGYWVRGCDVCSHQVAELAASATHVDEVFNDSYFTGGGAGYDDYLAEAGLLHEHGRNYARLLRRFTEPGYVLDVGSGAGFILKGILDGGWTGMGIEPNASMAKHARMVEGLAVINCTLEEYSTSDRYDLICMIQVAAHFYDIKRAFQVASGLTRAGGYWLIETWDRTSWTARILGKYWHEYSPPSVLRWFSQEDLRRLALQFGFQHVASGRPIKRISGSHAKSLLRYKLGASVFGRLAVRGTQILPDRLVIPYPSEDLFWMLLQRVA